MKGTFGLCEGHPLPGCLSCLRIDGFVKSPSAALHFSAQGLNVQEVRLALPRLVCLAHGAFYEAVGDPFGTAAASFKRAQIRLLSAETAAVVTLYETIRIDFFGSNHYLYFSVQNLVLRA